MFSINLDLTIIVAFLLMNLVVGIWSGRNVKTIKEYAVGGRNFSTASLAATVVATWISGSFLALTVSKSYTDGLWYVVAGGGDVLVLLLMAHLFGPRMREFFGNLSVAETIGNIYGKHVRIITAVAAIASAVGMIAMQLKVLSSIFGHFFEIPQEYATVVSSVIVILYAALGGIRSVTITDAIQFLTFGVVIPACAIFLWQTFGNFDVISRTFTENPIFDYKELLNIDNPRFFTYLSLFLLFSLPSLDPTMFQRTLMSANTSQIRKAFSLAAVVVLFLHLCTCFIGVVMLSHDANLNPEKLISYIADYYAISGVKGIVLISVMAMVMSTADSWINASSVIFSHDFCKPLNIVSKRELLVSRFFAVFIGTFALCIAIMSDNLLDLILLTSNFYMPIITSPLALAILGFRSTTKTVFVGMGVGAAFVIIWRLTGLNESTGVDSVIPAMFLNALSMMLFHYLTAQSGGWIKIIEDDDLKKKRSSSPRIVSVILSWILSLPNKYAEFSIVDYCSRYVPKHEITYIYFSICVLFSTITIGILNYPLIEKHQSFLFGMHLISLVIATTFFCYQMWNKHIRERYMGLIWCLAIFVTLSCISSIFVMITKFAQLPFMIFVLNLMMIGMLLNWRAALFMMIVGAFFAFAIYKSFFGFPEFAPEIEATQTKIIFTLFVIGSFIVAFIKPTQDDLTLAETKARHLWEKVIDMDAEVRKAEALKMEFLNNINHEVRAPITGITSLGQSLWDNYDMLPEKVRKDCVKTIAYSSDRLMSLMNNILDLSALNSLNLELKIETVNLTSLVKHTINKCKKLYLDRKELEFDIDIGDEILARCDEYHISHTVQNLIINAITYSSPGSVIKIKLTVFGDEVEFSIRDYGLGIHKAELFDIFKPFTVGSNTKTPAGGRGVGLALCFAVLKSHNGRIWAESDGESWAEFKFRLRA